MRLLLLFVVLAGLFLVPFLLFEGAPGLSMQGVAAQAASSAGGGLGWLTALVLLVGDLFLPVPSSGVQAWLGIAYGPLLGGLVAGAGLFLAGMLGYALGRTAPRRMVAWLLTDAEAERGKALAGRAGPWLIVLTRPLPLLPEILSVAAGLLRMRAGRFAAALACGSWPTGFGYALLGHLGSENPLITLAAAVVVPAVAWAVVDRLVLRRPGSGSGDPALQDDRQAEAGDRQ